MAEEQRLEKPVGNRAAVHRHERALAVVLVPQVQLLRNALLAHARFAAHQHAVIAVGKGAHLGQQRLHRFGVRHQHIGRLRRNLARAQLPHQLGDHRAQLRAGEVVRQHVQILGRISARIALARTRRNPDHRHALQQLGGMRQPAAVDDRDTDDRHRGTQRGTAILRRRRQAIGPDHLHVEARHAPRDAVEDVGFAFPDKEVEFVEVGGGGIHRRGASIHQLGVLATEGLQVNVEVRPSSRPSVLPSRLEMRLPTEFRMGCSSCRSRAEDRGKQRCAAVALPRPSRLDTR